MTSSHEPPLQHVSVIGLGTMGHAIEQKWAKAGHAVTAYDSSSEARGNASDRITANLKQMVSAQLLQKDIMTDVLSRITICDTERDAVKNTEVVTEAIAEDLELKQELFVRLENQVNRNTIIASNTSSFPVTQIAKHMQYPERAIVTHWFNPPHIVPVVEVVPGEQTADQTSEAIYQLLEHAGKTPVLLNREIPGFLVNRVQTAMFREIWDLLDRGVANAEQIDKAIQGSMGLRLAAMGPLSIVDFAGWDVTSRVYSNLIPDQKNDYSLPQRIKKMVEEKHFGVKSGHGVFEYPEEDRDRYLSERDRKYLQLVKLLYDMNA
ncbi:MAG: 3-hydroxyacyl-CoA dehydrogenase family protein [Planctomycetota bacterium]|nr:3-hydroxyacyl-CoA dehydrogenase family protein [Planctomycetota bacterium]